MLGVAVSGARQVHGGRARYACVTTLDERRKLASQRCVRELVTTGWKSPPGVLLTLIDLRPLLAVPIPISSATFIIDGFEAPRTWEQHARQQIVMPELDHEADR